jgi:outer membrane protein assembly factor BamB
MLPTVIREIFASSSQENAAMLYRRFPRLLAVLCLAGLTAQSQAALDVTTFHYDPQRTGWNAEETRLTPSSVSGSTFGKQWYAPLDGQVYGAPLVVNSLNIGGKDRSVVFSATENDTVYALDAATGTVLWKNHVGTAVTQTNYNGCPNINPLHGITGTPVIDRASNTLYACSLVNQSGQHYMMNALDLTTGNQKDGWPVELKGADRTLTFKPTQNTQRSALTLLNGVVYAAFSSRCDIGDWRGWLIGVPVEAPHTPTFFTTSLTSTGSGIWGSAGPSIDKDGNLYVVTGNGAYDLNKSGDNLSQSVLRLTQKGSALAFSKAKGDYYTPSNYAALNSTDLDLGGSSAIVVPDHVASQTPHLLLTGGKDGVVYLVNRDNLGGIGSQLDSLKTFSQNANGALITTTPAAFVSDSGDIYLYITNTRYGRDFTDKIKGIAVYKLIVDPATQKSKLSFAWTNTKQVLFAGTPVVSSNGNKDGILWVTDANKYSQHTDEGFDGSLCAFDALTGKELYRSSDNPTRDNLGEARKFSAPTVANGQVFLAGGGTVAGAKTNGIAAFGLLVTTPGDVNGDQTVNTQDAVLVLRAAVGLITLSDTEFKAGDFNNDGKINLQDATAILRKAVGL